MNTYGNQNLEKITLGDFLKQFEDYHIVFRIDKEDSKYNMDYVSLEEFKEKAYSFFLDRLSPAQLTSIKIYPQKFIPTIELYYERPLFSDGNQDE